jgi:3-oxoacyl-[acyl-carrier protein] reductase
VCLCARGGPGLVQAREQVAAVAGDPLRVTAVEADLSTPAGVDEVVTHTVERFGGVDILVNNVGLGRGAGLLDTPDETWQEAFDFTLYPAIRASRAVVAHMRARGGGAIVIVSSIFGREAGGRMVYNTVKSAENALAKAMAQQLAKDNIRVNAIAPGSIAFPGGSWWKRQQEDPQGIAAFVERELPFGRFGRAEEVGDVVAFVCSPRASWISGACLNVDGCQSRSNI